MNFDILKKTLDKDERWYKVGELIFPNNPDNKDIYSGYVKINDIKNEVDVSIKALENLNYVWKTLCTSMTWLKFKEFCETNFGVQSLGSLPINDAEIVCDLDTTKIELVARELALLPYDWWEYFNDDLAETRSKEELKTSLNNYRQQRRSPATQLKELIFMIDPQHTLDKFHTACNDCNYNDTLQDLKTICINYEISANSRMSRNVSDA